MQIKATLKVGSFLFGQGFSLTRNKQELLDSDSLSYADLSILASKIQLEQIESNVSSDKLLEIADKIKPESSSGEFVSTESVKPEILEVEVEEVVEDKKLLSKEDRALIVNEIEQAPTSIAVKSVKYFKEEGKGIEFFEAILKLEESTKKRPSVIKAVKSVLSELVEE